MAQDLRILQSSPHIAGSGIRHTSDIFNHSIEIRNIRLNHFLHRWSLAVSVRLTVMLLMHRQKLQAPASGGRSGVVTGDQETEQFIGNLQRVVLWFSAFLFRYLGLSLDDKIHRRGDLAIVFVASCKLVPGFIEATFDKRVLYQ